VEEIIEQIVTPFCVELCAEVDKLYSVNQVQAINIVRVSGSLRNLKQIDNKVACDPPEGTVRKNEVFLFRWAISLSICPSLTRTFFAENDQISSHVPQGDIETPAKNSGFAANAHILILRVGIAVRKRACGHFRETECRERTRGRARMRVCIYVYTNR
jgi:hypothetical protein